MSKIQELREDINNSRTRLLMIQAAAAERSRLGKENEAKAIQATKELERTTFLANDFRECMNQMVKIYKNIEQYSADRKKIGLDKLKAAIENAGYIVPDADAAGMKLDFDGKRATIVNSSGQDMNLREGSAFRTVLGALIRYTLIKSDPAAIQALILDEMFNTLSDETIVTMREYFNIFKEDMLILGIEQRDLVFQGIDKITYKASKANGVTEITLIEGEEKEEESFDEL